MAGVCSLDANQYQNMTGDRDRRCMMHKTLTTMIASLATAMLLTASPTNATAYRFTFESFDSEVMATGEITVNAADEVIAIAAAWSMRPSARSLPILTFPARPIALTVRSSTTTCIIL